MKTLYFECKMGAAGDMLMAALYEICDQKELFLQTMNQAFSEYGIQISAEESKKCGISGTHMHVMINGEEEGVHVHEHVHTNEHEAADLTGIAVMDESTALLACERLRRMGIPQVIITRGGEGAVYSAGDTLIHSPCIPCDTVADPTAAGDSFVGAFCTAVCAGLCHKDALEVANYVATLTVSRMGAQPSLPTLDEVLALMENQNCPCAAAAREKLQ